MQQRDCGCGKVHTPTLEELLAVARRKPLPTIRERTPPPARVGASLRGWVRWGLIDRSGQEVRGGEGPNLITDQGLDQIATQRLYASPPAGGGSWFHIIRYCAVGTDNTAPTVSDTALGTEVGRTDTTYQTEELSRTSDGVYELTRYVEFDYAEANGNLTEWGFSYDDAGPGLLFNRALFLDGGGSPEVVTKTSDYKLRIIYTLEITLSPVTLTAGAFTVTGVGTVNGDYTLVGGTAPASVGENCAAPDLNVFHYLARGELQTVGGITTSIPAIASLKTDGTDRSGVTYADEINDLSDGDNEVARDVVTDPRDAYVSGSFERTGGSWKFDTAYGNTATIKAFLISGAAQSGNCQRMGYVFDLDLADEFSKDSEHTLTIGIPTVSWGRGS